MSYHVCYPDLVMYANALIIAICTTFVHVPCCVCVLCTHAHVQLQTQSVCHSAETCSESSFLLLSSMDIILIIVFHGLCQAQKGYLNGVQ